MIFVTLGSQKFQFNRLLKEIDRLIENEKITEKVFAQTGNSDYIPKNYDYKKFLDRNEFGKIIEECDKVITHGGTGAIIGAIKKQKKVIAIPRLKKFGEHVDDHQLQIIDEFDKLKLIIGVSDIKMLSELINDIDHFKFKKYISNTNNIIESINEFIRNN